MKQNSDQIEVYYTFLTQKDFFYLLCSTNLFSFAGMNKLRALFERYRKNLKFSAENPENFEEVWSFNTSTIRVLSLFLMFLIVFSVVILYFLGPIFSGSTHEDISIERNKLEQQRKEIDQLSNQLLNQEKYINSIKLILLGEVPFDADIDSLNNVSSVKLDSLKLESTPKEKELAAKIKNDMRTQKKGDNNLNYFSSPVTGVISQKFDKLKHPGIDIVTRKDEAVKVCLAGTIIYSGYTRKDGHILIVDHANGFISVYKHNKTNLKSIGAKVKMGDPISIVGNTGENSDGPHLHFELWHNQVPVNPKDFVRFTK